jgi:hypothetical protein
MIFFIEFALLVVGIPYSSLVTNRHTSNVCLKIVKLIFSCNILIFNELYKY